MFNIKNNLSIEENYEKGLLPQRNDKDSYYQESSSRCRLSEFSLSSENRRILKKTDRFTFKVVPLSDFPYTPQLQKQLRDWVVELGWNFPASSIKKVFTDHIFNFVYIFYDGKTPVAYSICYFSATISHISYLFYNPQYSHSDLPIRCPLQFVIDSHQKGLRYAYLGRFDPETKLGFYKRALPGFEYYLDGNWVKYTH